MISTIDLSGARTGQLSGTRHGSLFAEFTRDGGSLSRTVRINEIMAAIYSYSIRVSISGRDMTFSLKPRTKQPSQVLGLDPAL